MANENPMEDDLIILIIFNKTTEMGRLPRISVTCPRRIFSSSSPHISIDSILLGLSNIIYIYIYMRVFIFVSDLLQRTFQADLNIYFGTHQSQGANLMYEVQKYVVQGTEVSIVYSVRSSMFVPSTEYNTVQGSCTIVRLYRIYCNTETCHLYTLQASQDILTDF